MYCFKNITITKYLLLIPVSRLSFFVYKLMHSCAGRYDTLNFI